MRREPPLHRRLALCMLARGFHIETVCWLLGTGMNHNVPPSKPIQRTVMRADVARFLDIERQATVLWERRGVFWSDLPSERPVDRRAEDADT